MNTQDNISEQQPIREQKTKHPSLWPIFLLVCIFIGIFYFGFKRISFSGYPKLTDLILDTIAIEGSNKTGEWALFWNLTWIGCFLCLFFFIIRNRIFRKKPHISQSDLSQPDLSQPDAGDCLVIFLPALVMTLLYADSSLYLWLFSGVFYLTSVFFRESIKEYSALFLFLYFDIQTVAVVLSVTRIVTIQQDFILFLVPAVLYCIFFILNKTSKSFSDFTSRNIKNLLGILQLPLPLLLLLYLKNTYAQQENIFTLHIPTGYLIFILLLIIGLYLFGSLSYKKEKRVTAAAVISVFLYGSYTPAALIVPTDMHHYGEQLLPFQQIAELSMKAYKDYAPVSGLYPMLTGFINAVLFQNKATTFYAACSVVMILFSALIFCLICRHIDASYALLFAFLFHMPVYSRTYLILPVLLFWMLPKVRENKRRFLYFYVFCGFLAGLYYPLFGLALICSAMPFAFANFAALITNLKSRKKLQSVSNNFEGLFSVTAETILLIIPIAACIPLLYRMAKHVLAYSHQTLLADGLSLSTCGVPDWFIPYLNQSGSLQHIRVSLYYAIRFLAPMAVMWFVLLLLFSLIQKNYIEKRRDANFFLSPAFLGLSGAFLILPVSYTYTLVIMDEGWISRLFSRSAHVWLWIFGIFLPIILIRFGEQILYTKRGVSAAIALSVTIGMISFSEMRDYQFPLTDGTTNTEAAVIGEYTANLQPFTLSEHLIPISETDKSAFKNLGSGFMDKDALSNLYQYQNSLAILKLADPNVRVLGLDSLQMYYFLLDEPCIYSGKPSLAKSYEAARTVFPFLNEHTAVGSDIKPLHNFYIYKAMLDKGFAYDPLTQLYLSKEIYISLYGKEAYKNTDWKNTPFSQSVYLAKAPSVLTKNMENLTSILCLSDTPDDFLYIHVDSVALEDALGETVSEDDIFCIGFSEEQSAADESGYLLTDFEEGIWLLPLSMNEDYAVHHYEDLYISKFSQSGASENTVKVPLKDVSILYTYYKLLPEWKDY